MQKLILNAGLLAISMASSPASGLERLQGEEKFLIQLALTEHRPPSASHAGRKIAQFEVGYLPVTLAAFGRKARARVIGNADEVRLERAMGKVIQGAPQPALLTFEMRVHF